MEWGRWDCPHCDATNEDPNTITITTCGMCGTVVILSDVNDNGRMTAHAKSSLTEAEETELCI